MANISLEEYNKRREIYKYEIGKLYDGDITKEINFLSDIAVFDDYNINFHLYSKDSAKGLDEAISESRKKIENIFVKNNINLEINDKKYDLEKVNIKDKLDTLKNNDNYSDKIIYIWFGSTGRLSNTGCKIFKYIAAVKNGVLYELNFMRFYISEDNKVNCIAKAIQFDRVVDNIKSKFSEKTVNRHGICYPKSFNDHNPSDLDNLIKENIKLEKDQSFFYNPQVSFDDDPKKILNEFIYFINKCDEVQNEKKECESASDNK